MDIFRHKSENILLSETDRKRIDRHNTYCTHAGTHTHSHHPGGQEVREQDRGNVLLAIKLNITLEKTIDGL